jgi:hypothetical protein
MWKSRRRLSWLSCVLGRNEINTVTDRSARKDWQRLLPGLVVSAVTLAVVLYFVDLQELKDALLLADYRYVAGAALLAMVWLAVRGLFWRTLLQEKANYRDVFLTLNEGYLLNNVLPFRLGEVARAFLLGRKAALEFWHVLSTILLERSMDVAFAASLVLFSLPFVVHADWAGSAAIVVGAVDLAGWVVLYLVALNQVRVIRFYERLRQRWGFLKRLGGNALPAFFNGLSVLTDPRLFLRALAWVTLNWGIVTFQYYLLLRAFFPQVGPVWAVFCLGVAALGIAAPSSPGGVGVLEAALVFALAVFRVDPSDAFAFAILAHLMNYMFTVPIGAYALATDGETLTGLYRSLRISLVRETPPSRSGSL